MKTRKERLENLKKIMIPNTMQYLHEGWKSLYEHTGIYILDKTGQRFTSYIDGRKE